MSITTIQTKVNLESPVHLALPPPPPGDSNPGPSSSEATVLMNALLCCHCVCGLKSNPGNSAGMT